MEIRLNMQANSHKTSSMDSEKPKFTMFRVLMKLSTQVSSTQETFMAKLKLNIWVKGRKK